MGGMFAFVMVGAVVVLCCAVLRLAGFTPWLLVPMYIVVVCQWVVVLRMYRRVRRAKRAR